MEKDLQDLKQHLMATNEEFSRLALEHSQHEQQLEELSRQPYLTEAQKIEEVKLKKRKLSLKDRMESILQKHKKDSCLTS
jgi:uncharacterized protein YdcH (DUF465 family)